MIINCNFVRPTHTFLSYSHCIYTSLKISKVIKELRSNQARAYNNKQADLKLLY